MPKIVGKSARVVDHEGITIDECAGNVATKDDTISIARVRVESPTAEPWLTLHYDEWICVTRGYVELHSDAGVITVRAGETAFIGKGERFRPVFPVGDTEYVPVCLPAFRPDRCIREENADSEVSVKLRTLHAPKAPSCEASRDQDHAATEVIYHMCQKELYEEAVAAGAAYFPPTFEADGMFTHATAVPERLIETANHFYTSTEGDWICLELSRSTLLKLGIRTKFEEAMPVGTTGTPDNSQNWMCPHIYGGIPTGVPGVVTKVYDMKRDSEGTFLSIIGVTDS